MNTEDRFRVGCVPYLNGRPLVAWLEAPEYASVVELTTATPAVLAALLEAEALDVALLSSIEAFRRPGLGVVDGICIASNGPVRSVRMFAKTDPREVRTLGADRGSVTSVALARIVLAERYGARPEVRMMEPDTRAMLAECDAALLIGDAAMRPQRAEYVLDLGKEWKEITGLPFVFALWVARSVEVAEAVGALLVQAKKEGLRRVRDVAYAWSRKTRIPLDESLTYLTCVIDYDLDDSKKTSLEAFAKLCRAHGIVGSPASIVYCAGRQAS